MGILVDTGAQANLVRMGLIPARLFKRSDNPLYLTAANGMPLRGDRSVILQWPMKMVSDGRTIRDIPIYEAEFFEAEIEADAILGYEWLKDYQLGIYPHRNALARDMDNLILLYGMTKNSDWNRKKDKVQRTQAVSQPAMQQVTPMEEEIVWKKRRWWNDYMWRYEWEWYTEVKQRPEGNFPIGTICAGKGSQPEDHFYEFLWKCNMAPPVILDNTQSICKNQK